MRRSGSFLIPLALVLAAAVSCSSDRPREASASSAAAGAPQKGGTARVGVIAEPTTFVDWFAGNTIDLYIADLVFRKLARPAGEGGALAPDLAESWKVLEDGRSIVFALRPGAKWEDGRELTAADVAFSEAHARAADASTSGSKREVEAVLASGPHEVVFRFRRSYPDMLEDAVSTHVYPEHLLASADAQELPKLPFHVRPIGSGPFRLEKWEPKQYLAFVPSTEPAPGGGPYLERLVLRLFADKGAALRELESGGLDLLFKVPREAADRLEARPDLAVHRSPTRGYFFVVWNTKRPPFDRVEVRQALTASIDRKLLASRFEGAAGRVSEGPVPPGHLWHDEASRSPAYDPAFAAERFRAAGLRRTEQGWLTSAGTPLRVVLSVQHGNQVQVEVATIVADQLRKAGIAAEVREADLAALRIQVEERGDFDAALYAHPQDAPVDLQGCFGKGGQENFGKLEDAPLEELFGTIARDSDPARVREAFGRATRRIAELQPWTFLHYRGENIVTSRRLRGVEACMPDAIECAASWWIPKEQQ